MSAPFTRTGVIRTLARFDRRAGDTLRLQVGRSAIALRVATVAARVMSPGFRALVALLIANRATRAAGLRALVASASAALIARVLRDRLARRRPGPRLEAGFPSRHSAAAAAIACAVAPASAPAGRALAGLAAVGMAARVATAEHEPADVVVGAILGGAIGALAGRGPFSRPRAMT
jgi:membrane-associated phospholipid phosphatase